MGTSEFSKGSWKVRLGRWVTSWKARWFPEPPSPVQVLDLSPGCTECGATTARVVLSQFEDGLRLAFSGVAGAGNSGADPISAEEADAVRKALSPPFDAQRIRAIGFYDDFGFCSDCEKFYCATHWQVAPSGCGTCPAGHSKSLDPHWSPDE